VADKHNRIEAGGVDVTTNRRSAIIETHRAEDGGMVTATGKVYGEHRSEKVWHETIPAPAV